MLLLALASQVAALAALSFQWTLSLRGCERIGTLFEKGYGAKTGPGTVECLYGDDGSRFTIALPTLPAALGGVLVASSLGLVLAGVCYLGQAPDPGEEERRSGR
ncbi:hypothetical protein GCM10023085_71320 [Actinomadura viridis]